MVAVSVCRFLPMAIAALLLSVACGCWLAAAFATLPGRSLYADFFFRPHTLTSKKILARLACAALSLAKIFLLSLFSLKPSGRLP